MADEVADQRKILQNWICSTHMRREKKGKLLEEGRQTKKGGSLTRTVTERQVAKRRENEKESED